MHKLALGTVQFGLDYGITNHIGQTSMAEVMKILTFAQANKIDTLDTAPGYGNSEQVLGEIGIGKYRVITKTIPFEGNVDKVISSLYQSLDKLNRDRIEGLLIHNTDDIYHKKFSTLFSRLTKLKCDGVIGKIGFSTYTPQQVDYLLENFDLDLIQVPLNVFDSRLIEGGQIQSLKRKNIEIHARSIFLQGVLLNLDNLPKYFSKWRAQFDEYQSVVKMKNMSLMEYALCFALGVQEVDRVLVGVSNERQIREIVQVAQDYQNVKSYPICNTELLNPSLWKI